MMHSAVFGSNSILSHYRNDRNMGASVMSLGLFQSWLVPMQAAFETERVLLTLAVAVVCLIIGFVTGRRVRKPGNGNAAINKEDYSRLKTECLGLMAGGMAHDFNNMLTTILGNASLARMEMEPNSLLDECLSEIEGTSLHASELCGQMLLYAGRGKFNIEPFDLRSFVAELEPALRESVPPNVALEFEASREPLPVEADREQVRRLILYLVTNASEAMAGQPGSIRIKTGARAIVLEDEPNGFEISPSSSGRFCSLEVSDTGCGIGPEIRARIFDPFFSTKPTGRGLGLAATLGIVQGHGGGIILDSEPQKGTVLTVLLPSE